MDIKKYIGETTEYEKKQEVEPGQPHQILAPLSSSRR